MKLHYVLLAVVTLAVNGCSDEDSQPRNERWVFQTAWNKNFGGTLEESNEKSILTSDGGVLMLGYTNSIDHDLSDVIGRLDTWVMKTNLEGEKEWSKRYNYDDDGQGGAGNSFEFPITLAEFPDKSGYLITGQTSNIGWIMKIDANGSVVWKKSTGEITYAGITQSATVTSNLVLVGGNGNGSVIHTRQIDTNGNTTWEKENEANEASNTNFRMITTGNSYLLTYRKTIIKLNTTGDIVWEVKPSLTASGELIPMISSNGNGYLIFTTDVAPYQFPGGGTVNTTEVTIISLSSDGDVVSRTIVPSSPNRRETLSDVIQDASGNFILIGAIGEFGSQTDRTGWIAEITPGGFHIGENILSGYYGTNSIFKSILPLNDEFILTGETNDFALEAPPHHYGHSDTWSTRIRF